jgi:ribosome-binding protein aMBF1 (putative translation factor)
MERGEFTPTIYTVQKLADAFEITLTEMIIGFDKSITALGKS